MNKFEQAAAQALEQSRPLTENGHVATYIPALSKADPSSLGIFLHIKDGRKIAVGEVKKRFSMQSISKIVLLAAAIERYGPDRIFSRVGAEPSGERFNSLVELDINSSHPYNPLINSGAITVASMMAPAAGLDEMLAYTRMLCMDNEISLNKEVFESEMNNCSRNRAIAFLLDSKGILEGGVEESILLYTQMCSLNVNAESLANLALILAADGTDPSTGRRLLKHETVRVLKVIMLTCGMYDESGTFALKVGLPTKSGVGGGLLSVADHLMGIGVYGPSLDSKGNSIAGCHMLGILAEKLHLGLFRESGNEE